MVEKQITQTQQITMMLNSKQFQDTLAKIVAPQVNNLIEPTVKKINQIEEQVGVLHDYVQETNTWQLQQTTKQNDLQSDMNTMTTGMQQLQETMHKMMRMQMEREGQGGMKRPAPAINSKIDPLQSPSRRRLQQLTVNEQLITQDSEMNVEYPTPERTHRSSQDSESSLPTANAKEQASAEDGGET